MWKKNVLDQSQEDSWLYWLKQLLLLNTEKRVWWWDSAAAPSLLLGWEEIKKNKEIGGCVLGNMNIIVFFHYFLKTNKKKTKHPFDPRSNTDTKYGNTETISQLSCSKIYLQTFTVLWPTVNKVKSTANLFFVHYIPERVVERLAVFSDSSALLLSLSSFVLNTVPGICRRRPVTQQYVFINLTTLWSAQLG